MAQTKIGTLRETLGGEWRYTPRGWWTDGKRTVRPISKTEPPKYQLWDGDKVSHFSFALPAYQKLKGDT